MDEIKKAEIIEKAIDKAGNIMGADPAYFGEEGKNEVKKQLREMGYDPKDFLKYEL